MDTTPESSKKRLGWRHLSLAHKVALIWFLISICLVFWGILGGSSFFVSPACFHAFLWPALLFSLVISIDFMTLMAIASAQPGPRGEHYRKMNSLMKYFVMPVVMFGIFGYIPMASGLPSLLNRILGDPYQGIYTVSKAIYENSRGSHCNHIYIKEFESFSFGKLCVSDAALRALKPGDHIHLKGTQSWFGIDVDKYAY